MKGLLLLMLIVLILILAAFTFFVGFWIGFAGESNRFKRKNALQGKKEPSEKEKNRIKKTKRDWKRFLEYDGSVPDERESE